MSYRNQKGWNDFYRIGHGFPTRWRAMMLKIIRRTIWHFQTAIFPFFSFFLVIISSIFLVDESNVMADGRQCDRRFETTPSSFRLGTGRASINTIVAWKHPSRAAGRRERAKSSRVDVVENERSSRGAGCSCGHYPVRHTTRREKAVRVAVDRAKSIVRQREQKENERKLRQPVA